MNHTASNSPDNMRVYLKAVEDYMKLLTVPEGQEVELPVCQFANSTGSYTSNYIIGVVDVRGTRLFRLYREVYTKEGQHMGRGRYSGVQDVEEIIWDIASALGGASKLSPPDSRENALIRLAVVACANSNRYPEECFE